MNPYDLEEVACAIKAACQLPLLERKMRKHKLRDNVRRNNIGVWVDSLFGVAFSRNLEYFTTQETVQLHEKLRLVPPVPRAPKEAP